MPLFRGSSSNDSEFPLISPSSSSSTGATTTNATISKKKKKKSSFASAALSRLRCASSSSSDASAPSPPAPATAADAPARSPRRRRPKQPPILHHHHHIHMRTISNNSNNQTVSMAAAASDDDDDDDDVDSFEYFMRRHHPMVMHRAGRHDPDRFHREIMKFQTRMSGGLLIYDRYRDWRLDVDRMSYEELLELGDRIGHVSTGLREDEISQSLKKIEQSVFDASQLHISPEMERKCSICQEEFGVHDDIGKLDCEHSYHTYCIKQWLLQKNTCPVCKTAVTKT